MKQTTRDVLFTLLYFVLIVANVVCCVLCAMQGGRIIPTINAMVAAYMIFVYVLYLIRGTK